MSSIETMETRKSRAIPAFTAGLLISAPGSATPTETAYANLLVYRPSGCEHSIDKWVDVVPISMLRHGTIPASYCGTGGESAVSVLLEAQKEPDVLSYQETIASIRSALSLQIKELAEILGVTRPTVYSWINNDSQPSADNRKRLQQVYRIASRWNQLCRLPAENLIRSPGRSSLSVLDLLKADTISEDTVVERLRELAELRMEQQANADLKQLTGDEIARRHGLKSRKFADQQHVIDAFTGKRFHPE